MKAEQSIAPAVGVRITPTVERDYARRNVFPSLRAGLAIMREGPIGFYNVTLDEAEQILADAKVQRLDETLPRGTPKAYTGLVDHLERTVREAKGEPPLTRALNLSPNASAQALRKHEGSWGDEYVGTVEQLVEAGLAKPDMFPGQPGRGKTQCSYELDSGTPLGNQSIRCRRKLVISRRGKRFLVQWPIDEEETSRRRSRLREKEAAEMVTSRQTGGSLNDATNNQIQSIFGLGNAFLLALEASPAKFSVGEQAICWDAEEVVEVIKGFGWFDVKDVGQKLGYVVRYGEGYERFVPAHLLLDTKTNRVRHLRLVKSSQDAEVHHA